MSICMFLASLIAAAAVLGIMIGSLVKPIWLALVCGLLAGFVCDQLWIVFLLPKVHA